MTPPVAKVAVRHDVVAEVQPEGDVLVMFEDGTTREYRSPSTVLSAMARRDRAEANRLGSAIVMTAIRWQAYGEPIDPALLMEDRR